MSRWEQPEDIYWSAEKREWCLIRAVQSTNSFICKYIVIVMIIMLSAGRRGGCSVCEINIVCLFLIAFYLVLPLFRQSVHSKFWNIHRSSNTPKASPDLSLLLCQAHLSAVYLLVSHTNLCYWAWNIRQVLPDLRKERTLVCSPMHQGLAEEALYC